VDRDVERRQALPYASLERPPAGPGDDLLRVPDLDPFVQEPDRRARPRSSRCSSGRRRFRRLRASSGSSGGRRFAVALPNPDRGP
jgi:hypothetical protein